MQPKAVQPQAGVLPASPSVQLDLHVDAGRQLELHQRIHRLVGRIHDVHEALVGAQLELVARVLVGVRRDEQR